MSIATGINHTRPPLGMAASLSILLSTDSIAQQIHRQCLYRKVAGTLQVVCRFLGFLACIVKVTYTSVMALLGAGSPCDDQANTLGYEGQGDGDRTWLGTINDKRDRNASYTA